MHVHFEFTSNVFKSLISWLGPFYCFKQVRILRLSRMAKLLRAVPELVCEPRSKPGWNLVDAGHMEYHFNFRNENDMFLLGHLWYQSDRSGKGIPREVAILFEPTSSPHPHQAQTLYTGLSWLPTPPIHRIQSRSSSSRASVLPSWPQDFRVGVMLVEPPGEGNIIEGLEAKAETFISEKVCVFCCTRSSISTLPM